MSLSSRRAWIEMLIGHTVHTTFKSRSPHGERGLKCIYDKKAEQKITVALLTESVD